MDESEANASRNEISKEFIPKGNKNVLTLILNKKEWTNVDALKTTNLRILAYFWLFIRKIFLM